MKFRPLLILLSSLSILACNSSPKKESQVEKIPLQTYTSSEIGWTMTIPQGFNLVGQAKIKASEEKGKEAIGKVYNGELKMDSLMHLLNFQKNQLNLFGATLERYVEKRPGDYQRNNEQLKKLLFDTYAKQKIKVDTSSAIEHIQGHDFHAFYVKIYGPSGAPIMNQILYGTMIKGYDFGVSINYDNEIDKKLILDAFKQSKFEK